MLLPTGICRQKKSQNCISFQRNVALKTGNVVVTSCLLQMVALLHEFEDPPAQGLAGVFTWRRR